MPGMIKFFNLLCIPYYSHKIKFILVPNFKIQLFLLWVKYKKYLDLQ